MTYYIDFDNTIFDTVSFYNDLKKVMYSYGINNDIIDKYQEVSCYSPLKLIDDLITTFDKTGKYELLVNVTLFPVLCKPICAIGFL